MLAVAYLVMRLIPHRLPRSDLIRQPGMLFLAIMIALPILLLLVSAFVSAGSLDEHFDRPCSWAALARCMPSLSVMCRVGMARRHRPICCHRLDRFHRCDLSSVSLGGLTGRRPLFIHPVRRGFLKKQVEFGSVAPEKLVV